MTHSAGIHSDVVITSRNEEALEETEALIASQAPGVKVHVVPGDLGDMLTLPELCSRLLGPLDVTRHEKGVLIHNAGSIDDFDTPFLELSNPKTLQDFFGMNVTSMLVLTTRFLSAFPSSDQQHVVHITSLLGHVFVQGFPLYSIAKAARNALMGTLKAELPRNRLLSYSPGPCDTEMYKAIPQARKTGFAEVLTPKESIQKLVKILKEDKYENGSTVDYFDYQ